MPAFGDYVDWEIGRNKRRQRPHVYDRNGHLTRTDYGEFSDPESKHKVADHWARALDAFAYDFDGPIAE